MKSLTAVILFIISTSAHAQHELNGTAAIGNMEGTVSLSYGRDWDVFKKKKFGLGLGARFTSYFGANQYYTTAPAELTSGETGLFVIFTSDIPENIDTFLIKSPQVNSLNLMLNMRYKINDKLMVGFNIDAIGFSFGSSTKGNYINGQEGSMTKAKPTGFNLLLTSDNDQGSLNSEFYGKYMVNDSWGVKLAAQFHFTEYTTETEVQQYPSPNDRFRNKSLMIALGVSYRL